MHKAHENASDEHARTDRLRCRVLGRRPRRVVLVVLVVVLVGISVVVALVAIAVLVWLAARAQHGVSAGHSYKRLGMALRYPDTFARCEAVLCQTLHPLGARLRPYPPVEPRRRWR